MAQFRFRLNFKQQFFLFFLCSSVMPLVLFSILFLGKTQHILTVRSVELLRTGLLLWQTSDGDRTGELLNRLPPELGFRILRYEAVQAGKPHPQVSLNGMQIRETLVLARSTGAPPPGLIPPADLLKRMADKPVLFAERIGTQQYRSMASILRDRRGVAQGYIVASLPRYYWSELVNEDTVYLIVSLLAAMVLVILLGRRFNHAFVTPMQALSAATHAIADGELDTRLNVDSDDGEIRRTVRDFNRMVAHLREKEDLRQNFIATLTHDLRTPLIAEKRALEFFNAHVAGHLDEQGKRLLDGLQVSNDNLLEMINHLLETFNYESGQIRLHPRRVPFRALTDACMELLRPLADDQGVRLRNQTPDTLAIDADAEQIKRVLLNLLGNSIQNLAPGEEVSVSARRIESPGESPPEVARAGGETFQAGREWVEITVSDTGPGLDEALMLRLFERYPAVAGRRQRIGSGLGLFICRMIVELHGGTISVSAVPDRGTCFRILLPPHPTGQTAELNEHDG